MDCSLADQEPDQLMAWEASLQHRERHRYQPSFFLVLVSRATKEIEEMQRCKREWLGDRRTGRPGLSYAEYEMIESRLPVAATESRAAAGGGARKTVAVEKEECWTSEKIQPFCAVESPSLDESARQGNYR